MENNLINPSEEFVQFLFLFWHDIGYLPPSYIISTRLGWGLSWKQDKKAKL